MTVTFPDDHPIEALRGQRRPGRVRMIRSIAERASFLAARIEVRASAGQTSLRELGELAALVMSCEANGIALSELALREGDVLGPALAKYRQRVDAAIARDRGAPRPATCTCGHADPTEIP